MKRSEIINSFEKINRNLIDAKLIESLDLVVRGRTTASSSTLNQDLLNALHSYAVSAKDYNSIDNQIQEILSLSDLVDPKQWGDLIIIKEPSGSRHLYELRMNIIIATKFLPEIIEIITPAYLLANKLSKGITIQKQSAEKTAVISLTLLDNSTLPLSTNRFISLFESIETFYKVSSKILDISGETLIIVGADSGSEINIDVSGTAKIIQMVKEILLSLWDRIMLFREIQTAKRISLVAQALPIVDQISSMEKDGKIEREQAEILRREVIDASRKFLSCGATIPEMNKTSTIKPNQLLAPEPKLISEGQTDKPDDIDELLLAEKMDNNEKGNSNPSEDPDNIK